MSTWSRSRSERCVKAENADRRSRLSPKNSARTGSRPVDGKTSTRPPRTENWPRSSTVSARSYPAAASSWVSSSNGRSSPSRSSTARGRAAAGGSRSTSASADTATRPPCRQGVQRPGPLAREVRRRIEPRPVSRAPRRHEGHRLAGQERGRSLAQGAGIVVVADQHRQAARLEPRAGRPERRHQRPQDRLRHPGPGRAGRRPARERREFGVVQEVGQGELRPREGRIRPLLRPFRHRRPEW